jgi:riboflavin synthase
MFTGLVEAVGTVKDFRKAGDVYRLSIECPQIASELVFGQSVAVGGACLTVVSAGGGAFDVEMMPETFSRTRFSLLSSLTKGSYVNLERAMRLDGRLEGHLVLGHVDGTAALDRLSGPARTKTARFSAPEALTRYVVAKGSVAVEGVSLTVIEAEKGFFSVGLIPATLESSTLGRLKPGDAVNVETDIVGKYVERLLGFAKKGTAPPSSSGALTLDALCELGYV